MKRFALFVLMLSTGIVLAEDQVRTEAPLQQQEVSRVQTDAAQQQAKDAEAETDADQQQAGGEQVQTEGAQEGTQKKAKVISGMSILGNQEAPKSLVIVPWKSSEIGDSMDVSTMLDDSRKPVDKEVFMRELYYYEIISGTKQ
jgi:hypothetical protein